MTVRKEDIEHVARLAALALEENALTELTAQIGQILEYVSQLEGVTEELEADDGGYPGPHPPLREDRARRFDLAIPLDQIAPAFREGLFLVPRLGAVGDSPEVEGE